MGLVDGKLHSVEINFPAEVDGTFFIKIDGVELKDTRGVKIESALQAKSPYPVVTVSFFVGTVSGWVEGLVKEEKA